MKRTFFCVMFIWGLISTVYCGQTNKVVLNDNSTENPGPTAAEKQILLANPDLVKSGVSKVQQQIANNPEVMQTVTDLANDPQFQEAMKDPELVKAAKAQDINALMQNEKFMNLIKNPKVKEIENKLEAGSK